MEEFGTAFGILLIFYLVILAFASIWGIISYIFTSLGMYTMANRRGIHNAWLAWIPIGDAWIAGSISDQYQQVAKNKTTHRRRTLMILIIVTFVGSLISGIASVAQIVMMGFGDPEAGMVTGALGSGLGGLITGGLSIAYSVVYYFCLYDLYSSAKPENAVLYLVLSILLGVVTPFLIFSCRNHDQGMVPPQPQYQPPVYGQQPVWQSVQNQPTQPTYQQPSYQPQPYQPQQPQYQPPQQPVEPWEQNQQ